MWNTFKKEIPSDRGTGEEVGVPVRWPGWWRWVVVTGCVLAGGGPSLAGGKSYLTVVGPPPLRFREAKAAPAASFVLPPLAMSSAEAKAAAQAGTAEPMETAAGEADAVSDLADPEPTGRPMTPPEPEESLLAVTSDSVPTMTLPGPEEATRADALALYPQYFLKYFEGTGTNRVGTAVVTPYRFIPPEPVRRSESRATYRVQPHP